MLPDEPPIPADDPLFGLIYRAVRKIGQGGMGDVFLAEHRRLGKLAVAKILHANLVGDARVLDRVRLEAQALGRLSHPNIVSILGAGETHDKRPVIVTEYLRGRTLGDEVVKRGPLPLVEALHYTCQLLHALAAAHAIGIIHRDIKPNNLFLCENSGGTPFLKVVDFGLARVMPGAEPEAPQSLVVPTDPGIVIGTPGYISPEAVMKRRVDHRADLYAAALVLYAAIAGRGPFDHVRTVVSLLTAHASEDPKPPSHFAANPIPPELDRVILRALRKAPEERFQTADEMRQALEQIKLVLERAPGLLETNVVDARSRAIHGSAASTDHSHAAVAPRSASRSSEQLGKESFVPSPSSARSVENTERPISRARVFFVFLSGALIAAAVVVTIISLIRGSR